MVPSFYQVKTAVDLVPFIQSLAMKASSARASEIPIDKVENLMLLDFVEH